MGRIKNQIAAEGKLDSRWVVHQIWLAAFTAGLHVLLCRDEPRARINHKRVWRVYCDLELSVRRTGSGRFATYID